MDQEQRRSELLAKLRAEGADDLSERLAKCGLAFPLWCTSCGHRHDGKTRCNRKWCPVCAPRRANERASKLRAAIRIMKWPLHITLTIPNVSEKEWNRNFLRGIVKSFAKLRRSKLWKKNVKGGAAGIEVTNKGKGWHPHIHAVIDCRWLSLSTPEPCRSDDDELRAAKFKCAAQELDAAWAVASETLVPTSNYIRRCDATAAAEIIKYAIKAEHVLSIEGAVAPILRMIDSVRMVTTFGSLRGLKIPDDPRDKLACPNGHTEWTPCPPLEEIMARLELKLERDRNARLADLQKQRDHAAAWMRATMARDYARHAAGSRSDS